MSSDYCGDACDDDSGQPLACESEVLSQDEDELKDGQDLMLGSLLEHELNRSIGKLRELEKTMAVANTEFLSMATSKSKSSTNNSGKSSELLEEIEMPSLSDSTPDVAELVSFSSGSPRSPVTSKILDRTTSSGYATKKKVGGYNSYLPNHPSTSEQEEADIALKIAEMSEAPVLKVSRLISVNENGLQASELSSGSVSCDEFASEFDVLNKQEKSANMTSSPVSSSCQLSAFECDILDLDAVNDSLLTSSMLKSPTGNVPEEFSIPYQHNLDLKSGAVEDLEDIQEKLRLLCEGAKEPKRNDQVFNGGVLDVSLNKSPNHRMTLGGVSVLNIEELNDSLLSSFQMINSPMVENDYNFPLPTPLAEYRKKLAEEQENVPKMLRKFTIDEANDFALLEKLLNQTHDVVNKSKSLNDLPKDVDEVVSLDTKLHSLEKLLGSKNCSFVASSAKVLNATFSPVGKKGLPLFTDNKDNCIDDKKRPLNEGDTTFNKVEQVGNQTFSAKENVLANDTFVSEQKGAANTTFDMKEQDMGVKPIEECESKKDDKEKLNVTFEKGEYRIASLNETVNLMDAEGEVLKMILDATPQKSSNKVCPDAASTPKSSNIQNTPAKSTVTKDPSQSFLHRLSLGVRRNNQNSSSNKPLNTALGQPSNLLTGMPGLKVGCISQQSVPHQLRRICSGSSGLSKNGPVRALPLAGMCGENSGEMLRKDKVLADEIDGMKTLDSSGTPGEGKTTHFSKSIGRPALPSFGSCSSIENERPSTPDLIPARGVMTSTPDVFRSSCHNMNPRITSTPDARIVPNSNVLGVEGPLPTPIIAPSSRSRFTTLNSTSSIPEQQGNPTWGSVSKENGNLSTPAKKSLEMQPHNLKISSQDEVPAIIPEGIRNPVEMDNHFNPKSLQQQEADLNIVVDVNECHKLPEREGISADRHNEYPGVISVSECERTAKNEVASETEQDGKDRDLETSGNQDLKLQVDAEGIMCQSTVNEHNKFELNLESANVNILDNEETVEKKSASKEDLESLEIQDRIASDTVGKNVDSNPVSSVEGDLNTSQVSQMLHQNNTDSVRNNQQEQGEANAITDNILQQNAQIPIALSGKAVTELEGKLEGDVEMRENLNCNVTKVIEESTVKHLDSTVVLKKDDGMEKRKSSGTCKSAPIKSKKMSLARSNSLNKNSNPSLQKRKSGANKENVENDIKSTTSTLSKTATRTRSQTLGAKLPSHRISLAPSNIQSKKIETGNPKGKLLSGKLVLKENNGLSQKKPLGMPTIDQPVQAKTLTVKKAVNVSPLKPRGLKLPDVKRKEQSTDGSIRNGPSGLQPPVTSKLPVVPRSYSGTQLKGVVRSQSMSSSHDSKSLGSKLSGIRPPQSKLPAPSQMPVATSNTGSILRAPSKLVRPKKT